MGELFDRAMSFESLWAAAGRACRGHLDRPAVARFWFHLETEIFDLERELLSGTYHPRPYTTFVVFEPKRRLISAADIRDRVVHHAACQALEPLLERRSISDSFACRTGKGTHRAVARARTLGRRYAYVLSTDVRRFFPNVDHAVLESILARVIPDRAMRDLVRIFVRHGAPECEPGRGLPIGNLTSQHFANLYLGELDHEAKDRLRVPGYVRYMDEVLLFADSKVELWRTFAGLRAFLRDRLRLEFKPEATRIAPVTEGFGFLGFRIFPGLVRVDRGKLARMRRRVRALERGWATGRIDDRDLAARVQSMVAHLRCADSLAVRRQMFEASGSLG